METRQREGGADSLTLSFDVRDYLDRRARDESFVMVEFGHDALPVAYKNGQNFNGQRAYVGIEAWLRDPWGEKRSHVERLSEQHAEVNTFFLQHELGGAAVRDVFGGRTRYDGHYSAETILPDRVASEVFASNVLGDPHIAESRQRTTALLSEMARVLEDDGVILLRETITPHYVRLEGTPLCDAGLAEVVRITPDSPDWVELERLYRAESGVYASADGAHYRVLQKV